MTAAELPLKSTPVPGAWPTTRILFALAGTVGLVSATLAATVSPWFLLLTGFVSLNQLLYVAAGACPASLLIDRWRRTTCPSVVHDRDRNEVT